MQSDTTQDEVHYLTAADVRQRLRISQRTLDRYVADDVLSAQYLPSGHRRFLAADVDALLTPEPR
ncbi:helix-turn-helix domain-containing protein [Agrococcus jejuensis]|uniref:helix-turn-helix domain-containing protein n=1 Tax=Agrococcus jejuensis TaxID=399736 RepID=UPI0011A203CA|nr:helix-turn-helix domain-containing protein [Agrococcus jejuensis]